MRDHNIFEKVNFSGIVPGRFIIHTRAGSSIIESHWHPELEINMVFEGSSRFFINGSIEDLSVSHMVLINSKDVHSSIPYYAQNDGFVVTGVTLLVSYEFLKMAIPGYDSCYFVLNEQAEEEIRKILTEMCQASAGEKGNYVDTLALSQVSRLVYILATECCERRKEVSVQTASESYRQLEQILLYIHDNYDKPLRMLEVAEQFHFSKEYFCRLFKKYSGITFTQYLTECRVVNAEHLLINTDSSIAEIAQLVGFSDEGRFISQFRKYYGDTPGSYRRKIARNSFYQKK